jgi:hypothetical protein
MPNDGNQGDDQKQVNETAADWHYDGPEKPEDYNDDCDREKHRLSFLDQS